MVKKRARPPGRPEFTDILRHERGTLYGLLVRSYAELLASGPEHWQQCAQDWERFDAEAFANPGTVGACVFVSVLGSQAVGFGSYDPRQAPEVGVIGHNCVAQEFRGRGIGTLQIDEIVRRLRERGIRKAIAQTSEHPFFASVRRMYARCGFEEVRRLSGGPDPRYGLVEFAQDLHSLRP